ncbi:MAG: M50 family metallopeptidase [Polyangiaceae bacterium]|nr:M50 family metallopeptidase [Polyangiaceae bacterium]
MTTRLLHSLADTLDLAVVLPPAGLELHMVAIHEAGHAVAAVELNIPVSDVTVTRHNGGVVMLASNPRGTKDVVVSLAGPIAESILLQSYQIALDVLVVGCELDIRDAWQSTAGSRGRRVAHFIRLYEATRRLVTQRWPAVLELAGHLVERRFMPANEVYAVLRAEPTEITWFLEPFERAKG